MWIGIQALLGKQAGEADTGQSTLRESKGRIVNSSRGKGEILVEHYRKVGTPTANAWLNAEFENKFDALVEANMGTLEKEYRGSDRSQKEFARGKKKGSKGR